MQKSGRTPDGGIEKSLWILGERCKVVMCSLWQAIWQVGKICVAAAYLLVFALHI